MIVRFGLLAELSEQQLADWLLVYHVIVAYIWNNRKTILELCQPK